MAIAETILLVLMPIAALELAIQRTKKKRRRESHATRLTQAVVAALRFTSALHTIARSVWFFKHPGLRPPQGGL